MYNLLIYDDSLNLYNNLKNQILKKMEKSNDFIVILPNENLIERLRNDILIEYNSVLDFKIFTFDDLINYKKINLLDFKNEDYFNNLILRYSINRCIKKGELEDNSFYNSTGFLTLALKFISYIKSSIVDIKDLEGKIDENSSLFSIVKLYNEFERNSIELDNISKFEKYYEFMISDRSKNILQNIDEVFIAGFLDFRKIEYKLIEFIKEYIFNIDIYYEKTIADENMVFQETKKNLERLGFNVKDKIEKKSIDREIILVEAEDRYLEIKRLAIEIKKNLLKNSEESHGIIINDNQYKELIVERFKKENIVIETNEELIFTNSKIGKYLYTLLNKDIELKEYIINNLKNILIFNEPILDMEFENLLKKIEFTGFDELFMSNNIRSHVNYNDYYIFLNKIYKVYSLDNKEKLLDLILEILKIYEDEDAIYSEFAIFIEDLNRKFSNLILEMSYEEFIRYILDTMKIFKINIKGKYRSNIQIIDFNNYKVLNHNHIYFVGFNDETYPKLEKNDYYFNKKNILEYRKLGFDILTSKFKKSKDRLNFENIISNKNNIYISYEISKDGILSEFVDNLSKENIVKEKYSFRDYIKPVKENIIDEYDKDLFLANINDIKEVKREKTNIKKDIYSIEEYSNFYSSTKLETYLRCPARYFYRYVLKLENKFIDEKLIRITNIGTGCHDTLEYIYKEYFDIILDFLEDDTNLFKILKNKLEAVDFNTNNIDGINTVKRYTHLLKKLILNDIKYTKNLENSIIPYKFEENFSVVKKLDNGEFQEEIKLIGRIDRIDKDKYGNLYLADYKLGKHSFKTMKDFEKKKTLQFPIYSLIGEVKNCRYLTINDSGIHEFYNREKDEFANINSISEEGFLYLKKNTLKIITEIVYNIKNENYFIGTEDNKNCKFCQYVDICEYRG